MVRSPRTKGQKKGQVVEEKSDTMGAKIEDEAKKGEIEAEPPEKKVKVSNSLTGDAKELKQRQLNCRRLGISEDDAEKLLKSEDDNSGRRTRSRSRGNTNKPSVAKKTPPAKETPSKRGRKAKKAAPAPAATSAEEDEDATAEKAEEAAKEDAKEEAGAEDGDEAAAKEDEDEEDGDAAEPTKEGSEEKDTDDGDAKKE